MNATMVADTTETESYEAEGKQLVGFQLADEEYGIEIGKVREIILVGDITRIPQTPRFVKGLINLRSTVIPIIDLRLRFGIPEAEATDETRIVVTQVNGKTIGIIVDSVNEVLRVSREQIAPPPPTVAGCAQDYLLGLANLEDRLLILLDIEKILDDETDQALSVLSAKSEARLQEA